MARAGGMGVVVVVVGIALAKTRVAAGDIEIGVRRDPGVEYRYAGGNHQRRRAAAVAAERPQLYRGLCGLCHGADRGRRDWLVSRRVSVKLKTPATPMLFAPGLLQTSRRRPSELHGLPPWHHGASW
jgi:hypothetical protein